jgi:hypothetical protein
LKTFRPQQIALGIPINLLINTLVMRFVVKRLSDVPGKVSLVRCAICAILLYLVSSLAIALLLFPTPLIILLAFVVWLVGSMAVIRGVFQLTYQGGGGILFLYLLVLVLIHLLIKIFMR